MPALSGNQKSMRMYVRKPSTRKKPSRRNSRQTSLSKKLSSRNTSKHKSRISSLASLGDIRNGSIDLAPKVRKNKKMKTMEGGMFNFEEVDNEYQELEKVTKFLKLSLKSKNIKEYIKKNQEVFDIFIDRVDSGRWMGIDLRSMHGFFVKCFKNKVNIFHIFF